ncbi:Carbohydrate-binding domain-containing protein Cthe_2159 like protein, partial [Aduncisulcus paluster]
MLNGFDISSNDGSAILITGADEVTLTLMTGTENSIQDSSPYFEENANVDVRSNGAIFTSDDFAVNGGGSLTITTENKTGILGKKDVLILDGTIQIESPRNGIKGNDLVYIAGGQTEIQAGTDGIESEDLVYMTDGTLDVLTSYEGIEALDIIIDGGAISIQASDDGVNI